MMMLKHGNIRKSSGDDGDYNEYEFDGDSLAMLMIMMMMMMMIMMVLAMLMMVMMILIMMMVMMMLIMMVMMLIMMVIIMMSGYQYLQVPAILYFLEHRIIDLSTPLGRCQHNFVYS